MSKRILCCVETTKQGDTDSQYIRETIRYYYVESSKIVIRMIHMESKSKYNSRSVKEQIKRYSTNEKDTHVIYFIDTDDYDVSIEDTKKLEKIKQYCDDNHYDLVFFCKDIEDVYWGHRVPDTEKISAVKKFKSSNAIQKVNVQNLTQKKYQAHGSNILNVLDRFMQRKQT